MSEEESMTKRERYEALNRQLIQYNDYYQKHFDMKMLWKVIEESNFSTREFGFEAMEINPETMQLSFNFLRNKSFRDPEDLQEYLSIFHIASAYIGALYKDPLISGIRSKDHVSIHDTEWLGRELIFDLDLNEYDPVRTCGCTGRKYCTICWGLMQDAAAIMDETLREDFGFKKLQWVFTGGRGYHCWILDDKLFEMTQEQRSGIVHYMQLINDPLGEQRVEPVGSDATPLRERIYRHLLSKFITNSSEEVFKEINIGSAALKSLRENFQAKKFVNYTDLIPSRSNEEDFMSQMIKYYYPRIDHKVTIDTRRLIRMPGSVHGRTGLISQYINKPETFDPSMAKHINDLVPL